MAMRKQPDRKVKKPISYTEAGPEHEGVSAPTIKRPRRGYLTASLNSVPLKQATSPLMKLPAEVRNMIYEYAFLANSKQSGDSAARNVIYMTPRYDKKPGVETTFYGGVQISSTVNLLQACREINHEATSFIYGSANFVFANTTALHIFLRKIGRRNLACLRSITLRNIADEYAAPSVFFTEYSYTLNNCGWWLIGKCAWHLKRSQGLCRLRIDFHNWYDGYAEGRGRSNNGAEELNPDWFVREFLPVFAVINRTRGAAAFFDVFDISAPECRGKTSSGGGVPSIGLVKYIPDEWLAADNEDGTVGCRHFSCNKYRRVLKMYKQALSNSGVNWSAINK